MFGKRVLVGIVVGLKYCLVIGVSFFKSDLSEVGIVFGLFVEV